MSPLLPALFVAQAITSPAPDSRLTPEQVVGIVAAALRHNNSPVPNAGIFTAYRFASPANHAVTGPYGRFLRVVKTPGFTALLADYRAEFGAITREQDYAWQVMRVRTADGKVFEYRWDLSFQKEGRYRGAWMVDGVTTVP